MLSIVHDLVAKTEPGCCKAKLSCVVQITCTHQLAQVSRREAISVQRQPAEQIAVTVTLARYACVTPVRDRN